MEDVVPSLALTLGRLRRSPGRDEGWVINVVAQLERSRPEEYGRLRQRLDFAARLGKLAGMNETRGAAVSLGLLFDTLAALAPAEETARPPRPWMQYLLRNDDWLAPCLVVTRAIRQPGWAGCADYAEAVVAKVAKTFVGETYAHQPSLLSVLQSVPEEADSPSVKRVVEALRSEQGQQLCDRQMRFRGGQHWALSPKDLMESLRLLKRTSDEAALIAPVRLSSRRSPVEEANTELAESREVAVAAATSENFERRKQALRAGTSPSNRLSAAGSDETGERMTDPVNESDPPSPSLPEPEMADAEEEPASSVRDAEPDPHQLRQEEEMQISNEQPEWRLTEGIQALRSQLDQMERAAAQAREILATIAPKLEEFSAWADDLEAVVRRRSGRTESRDAAA